MDEVEKQRRWRPLLMLLAALRIASADPAPKPINVAPKALEALRTAGDKVIEPDAKTKKQIEADQTRTITSSYVVCIDSNGVVDRTELLKPSQYPDWDERIRRTMVDTWRYRSYKLNEKPTPVCTAITQIYRNPKAPARNGSGRSA